MDPLSIAALVGAGVKVGSWIYDHYWGDDGEEDPRARATRESLTQMALQNERSRWLQEQASLANMYRGDASGRNVTAAERAALAATAAQQGQMIGAARGARGGLGALAMYGAQRQAAQMGGQGVLAAAQARQIAQSQARAGLAGLAGQARSQDLAYRQSQLGSLGQLAGFDVQEQIAEANRQHERAMQAASFADAATQGLNSLGAGAGGGNTSVF